MMTSILPYRTSSNPPNGATPATTHAARPTSNSTNLPATHSKSDGANAHAAPPTSDGAPSWSTTSARDGLTVNVQVPSSAPSPASVSRNSVIVTPRPRVRPQYAPDSDNKHVEYILVASFDIDRGSIMEHQYPAPIGGDEHMLAELMLPDQAHVRSQDWTIFFLHKDAGDLEEARQKHAALRNPHTGRDSDQDYDQDEAGLLEDQALESLEGPPLVYVLNLVNTKQDNTVKRGAVVKAMAICTRHSFLHIYKPLLLLALDEYFRAPVPETLASLYNAVNDMDLSLLPRLSYQERFILQASDVKDLFIEKFEAMIHQRMAEDKADTSSSSSSSSHRYPLPRDTHEFESIVKYNNVPVPVKIPTALSPETVGDFSLIKLIQTFSTPHATAPQPFTSHHPHLTTSGPLTHPIIVLLNALLTQKRVIFIGHNLPSSDVAEAVLAACALASGGMLRGFTRHAFPYTDLTKIDDLLQVPGFIAGVTNPTFTHKPEWWDLLCDLPTGRIKISPNIEQAPLTEGLLFFQNAGSTSASSYAHVGASSSSSAPLGIGPGASPYPVGPGSGDPPGDAAFMAGVLTSIADRRGEGAVRAKFRLWIVKFIRLASAFEEMVYGASALSIHSPPTASPTMSVYSPTSPLQSPMLDPAVTGHGYVWPTNDAKVKELAANATRIEGWRTTRSYYNFVQDFAVLYTLRPIQDLDLQHLHDRLSKLRLGPDTSAAIYLAICNRIQTYEQVNQLLCVLVNASISSASSTTMGSAAGGGLFYLSLGLFHPKVEVREAIAELLGKLKIHEAGRHFWNKLGRFEKAAWDRVVVAQQMREEA